MKFLKLTLDRLATDIKRNPLTTSLFVIGTILSTSMIIYFWGNFLPSKITIATQSLAYRQVQINFVNSQSIDSNDLLVLDKFGVNEVVASVIYNQSNSDHRQLVFSACKNNNKSGELYPTLFDESQLNGNNIITPMSDNREGFIEAFNLKFNIVKKLAGTDDSTYYVPIQSIIDNRIKINRLTFILKEIPDTNTTSQIREIITNTFDNVIINDATNYTATDDAKSISVIIMILFSGLISIFSYMFLFNYIIENNKIFYIAYLIVGSSKLKIIISLVMEISFLSLLSSILAILIHKLLYNVLFCNINIYSNITYNTTDYIMVSFFCVILSSIAALPYSIKLVHSSLANLKKEVI